MDSVNCHEVLGQGTIDFFVSNTHPAVEGVQIFLRTPSDKSGAWTRIGLTASLSWRCCSTVLRTDHLIVSVSLLIAVLSEFEISVFMIQDPSSETNKSDYGLMKSQWAYLNMPPVARIRSSESKCCVISACLVVWESLSTSFWMSFLTDSGR